MDYMLNFYSLIIWLAGSGYFLFRLVEFIFILVVDES